MPKLKQLVAELDELQRKLTDVEASMSKATSVLELQLFELEETKLLEAYQRKNAELLRKKQRLRKKEFTLGQQNGTFTHSIQSFFQFWLRSVPKAKRQRVAFSYDCHTQTHSSSMWPSTISDCIHSVACNILHSETHTTCIWTHLLKRFASEKNVDF